MFYTNPTDISKIYPYGEFPSHYTKKQKENDINNPKIFNYYTMDKFIENTKNKKAEIEDKQTLENPKNNFDFKTILPIISSLSNGKKTDNKSLITTLLPLLAGSKAKDIGAIMKLFENKPKSQEKDYFHTDASLPPSTYNPIDSYERI